MGSQIFNFIASNNQGKIKAPFLPVQNPPRTHKTEKSSQFDSRRLAVVHHRQTIHLVGT